MPFAYIGQALDRDGFSAYVARYNFGPIPPDYVVIHSTEIPPASWAPLEGHANWDDNESGLSDLQIRTKRKAQLDGLMHYYSSVVKNPDGSIGWPSGPHLFIDERWIWLFTPMNTIGVHAAEGNSYTDKAGLHYSIGVEVVGYYEHTAWPAPVAANVAHAVATLKQWLQTFDFIAGPWAGKISRHADYNKPECPGSIITPSFYLPLFRDTYATLTLRTYRAGPFGAIAFQAPRPDALPAASWMPGESIISDKTIAGFAHVARSDPREDVGFIPLGCLEEAR